MKVLGAATICMGLLANHSIVERVALTEISDATAHMLVRRPVFIVNNIWNRSQDINVRPC